MASDQTIAELKRQLGETVDRIDSIQQGRQLSLAGKISKHFKTQSGSLINIVLTASLVAVSLGKLQQKQQHQGEKGEWQEQKSRMQGEHDRLSQQVSGLQQQLVTFQHHVQSELDEGGFRFGPVKSRLQQLLADFAYSSCSDESSLTDRQASDNTRHTMRQLGSEPILDPSDQSASKTSTKGMMI